VIAAITFLHQDQHGLAEEMDEKSPQESTVQASMHEIIGALGCPHIPVSVLMRLHAQTILSAVGQLRVANNASTSRVWRKLWKRTDRGREDDMVTSGENREGLQYTVGCSATFMRARQTSY